MNSGIHGKSFIQYADLTRPQEAQITPPPGFVICPTCKGHRYLFVYDEEFPNEPPHRHYCCSCMGKGIDREDK